MRTQREDERPILELEVVRSDEARGTTGRPLFLDARRFIRICRLIEHGESASEASGETRPMVSQAGTID